MEKALLVGLGGFLGTILLFAVGQWVGRLKAGWPFPLETLVINVVGCLVLGALAGWSDSRGILAGTTRAVVFIGLIGGFTTFSAFGYETLQLLNDGRWRVAALSASLQVVLGVGGVWAGQLLARQAG